MTGPHLTPEREADDDTLCPHGYVLPEAAHPAAGLEACVRCGFGFDFSRLYPEAQRLAAALDAERAAHNLTRTALTGQAEKAIRDVKTLQAELADRIEALTQLRNVWNAHMETCPQHAALPNLPAPTLEQITAWMNAPSDTASGAGGHTADEDTR